MAIPKAGDIAHLNDQGIEQCFGPGKALAHMKELDLLIVYVDPVSITSPEPSHEIRVSNPDFDDLTLYHWCVDVVA